MINKYSIIFNNDTKKYMIEVVHKFLFFSFKRLLTYTAKEPSFSDDGTTFLKVSYEYQFDTYCFANKFLERHNLF